MRHIKKDLANEITKEKNQKSTIDTDTIKVRKELEELRKQLSDFKQTEADSIRKLRNKYETEIDELDLIIEKAKKDKGSNQKNRKKIRKIFKRNTKKVRNIRKRKSIFKRKRKFINKRKKQKLMMKLKNHQEN